MDVAFAPPHRPETRSDARARGIQERLSKCKAPGRVADQRCVDVALAKRSPERAAALQANARRPLSLSNLPHSMLQLAGIQADGLDLSRSVFSPMFAAQPRSYIVRGALHTYAKEVNGAVAP